MNGSLARLRFPVTASRGRRYPEPPHRLRNDFQRDRDRIVHSRAFRRLEDKTQVFTAGISDHFRNRLTHTIEVSQIARTAASFLGLDEDLTEALALAHDIGHPPFGHAGERELNRLMKLHASRFEHNLHALHIVETFEQRYAMFPGLNLTFELREGIVKHSRDFEPGEDPELDEYLPGLRPPLEAQLIDLADEVAYNTADLDDAHSAEMVSTTELAKRVPEYREIEEIIQTQYPGAPPRIQFLECVRRIVDALVSSLVQGTAEAVASTRVHSLEDVRTHPDRLARFTPQGKQLNASLKTFLHQRVYDGETLRAERARSTVAIEELFYAFLENPARLPLSHQHKNLPLHRIVCDYIAGMTDGFFWRTHQSLCGDTAGVTPRKRTTL